MNAPLPGAPPLEAPVAARLETAWTQRKPGYQPRTKHLNPGGSPRFTNRLFLEPSPYLQQHAHNPVNWYPWGDDAFEAARKLGRPVLLSVGYSTCHWCHVMEEESFEDEEIARYLNEHYVAIKVDREERPDVDAIYMAAVQRLTGGGGWPMTVWLTVERKPFYGGTYFPARDGDRGEHVGFLTVLKKLDTAYRDRPKEVVEAATSLAETIRADLSAPAGADDLPGARVLRDAAAYHAERYDPAHGGRRGKPKFPSSLPIRFLLRYQRRAGDAKALEMATVTLERMAAGGIHDQVGGGFHRYSTDERWLVPHFEKMLYDNALLAVAYLDGYQATERPDFALVVRDVLRWVERDMTSPDGAFYSATDADSRAPSGEREEGWFFTWTPAEIRAVLNAEEARLVEASYGVSAGGNFEGRSILHTPRSLEEVAKGFGLGTEGVRQRVDTARETLYGARANRPAPLRDEKILTAWNGLAISAYAQAALVLADEAYAHAAARAADFVLRRMRTGDRLHRAFKDGRAYGNAYLEDYAFLIAGLLDLYEATGELHWLADAIALEGVLDAHYGDERGGGYFLTGDDHEVLLAREKPSGDGAEPSGNSVQALNLLRLYELTSDDRYRQRAEGLLRAFAPQLERAPGSLSEMLHALDFHLDAAKEIVIVTAGPRSEAEPFLSQLRATFVPNRVLVVARQDEGLERTAKLVPLVAGKVARDGKPTAYVCKKRVCDLPTSSPAVFAEQLGEVKPLGAEEGGRAVTR